MTIPPLEDSNSFKDILPSPEENGNVLDGIFITLVRIYDILMTQLEITNQDKAITLDKMHTKGQTLMSDPIMIVTPEVKE